MLRELLDRLCRRGDFAPITYGGGVRDREGLPPIEGAYATPGAVGESVLHYDDLLPQPATPSVDLIEPDLRRWSLRVPTRLVNDPTPRAMLMLPEDLLEAQAIVRMLAVMPPVYDLNSPDAIGWTCVLCDAWDLHDVAHEPTCPYQRAVEWVEANPA